MPPEHRKFHNRCGSKYRFHDNELQLQLDLQASTLVADLATTELDQIKLHETITAKNWFHVLLIRTEDLDANGPARSFNTTLAA